MGVCPANVTPFSTWRLQPGDCVDRIDEIDEIVNARGRREAL
jgi:hypothetical protein